MSNISVLGIDLAKQVFYIHGTDKQGREVLAKRLSRERLRSFVANIPPCLIGMEACGGAHYWARTFARYGHEVRLISPQFVKPYVKTNKNDAADAQAIAEAVSRPHMRFVPIKQVEHQDVQNFHRVRERLIKTRTALGNEIRGLLNEYGVVMAKHLAMLRKQLPLIIEDKEGFLTPMSQGVFASLLEELWDLDARISFYEKQIIGIFKSQEICQRISAVKGIGPITATALYAAVSDARVFRNGRQFSAWLGLVPRQHSTGGETKLLGISKRGDKYLRKLLIHGARAQLSYLRLHPPKDIRDSWALQKERTRGFNKACVALANKNARQVWVLMARGEVYKRAA